MRTKVIDYFKRRNYTNADAVRVYYALMAFALLIISVLAEVFVFNYKHWSTLNNSPESIPFVCNDSLVNEGDGVYRVVGDEINIELVNLNKEVSILFAEIVNIDALDSDEGSIITVDFDAKDYSHYNYYSLNRRVVSSLEPRSYYYTLHLYGDAKTIKIRPYIGIDARVIINLVANPVIPIFFRWERIILLYAVLLLVLFFNPGSYLHKIKYTKLKLSVKYVILCTFLIANALILYWVNGLNPFYQTEMGVNTIQYQELAEAFSKGQLSLLDEPTDILKSMENPYDMDHRGDLMEFEEWYFDHAYYDGKYYVYFGVVPCALIYFPYYILTGTHIHNHTVCYMGILLILMGMVLLLDEIIRKYFKKCSVAVWFLLAELMLLGSYVTYVTKRPDLYSVPIIYAVAFAFLGMWGFMKSIPYNAKMQPGVLNKGYLVLGSVLTALIAGCRPQLFLVVIIDVIIMKDYIFDLNYLKSSDGIKSLISVFTPMIIIGGLFMTYNYLRFGSLLDFGAYYNLTFNDMRYRGFAWDRIPYGIAVYLLHPMEFIPEYPYFGNIEKATKYMGVTIQETTYGGLFAACPFALVSLTSLFGAKKMKKKMTPWLISIASVAIAIVVMIFDTENSGILARYFFDFSFLWMIGAVMASLILLNMKKLKNTTIRKVLIWILVALVIYEAVYQILVFMLDSGDYLKGRRQDLFYHYYYMFGFGI